MKTKEKIIEEFVTWFKSVLRDMDILVEEEWDEKYKGKILWELVEEKLTYLL